MLWLRQTQVHKRRDRVVVDLRVKQVLVVKQKFLDRFLCEEGVAFCRGHGLLEEQVDPLSHVVLVGVVVLHTMLQYSVDQAANLRVGRLRRKVIISCDFELERINQTVDQQIKKSGLSQDLLSFFTRVSCQLDRILVVIVVHFH